MLLGFVWTQRGTQSCWIGREYTKEWKERILNLCLLLLLLTRPYRENRYLRALRYTVALNSYLGLFALCKKFFFALNITLTREANLCPNILNTIRIIARISKFRCFHETKQTQNEVERFCYNLAEFVFECFHDRWRILASLAKFFSNRFSQHDRTVEPVPITSSSARSSSPPSPTHAFLTQQIFTNPFPGSQFFLRVRSRPISARKWNVAGKYLKRFSEIPCLKLRAGEGFCKDLLRQKTRVGDGG